MQLIALAWLLVALAACPAEATPSRTDGTAYTMPTCGVDEAMIYNEGPDTFTCQSVGGGGVPAGSIILTLDAACPSGFLEVSGLSGMTLIGTVAASANVGTTGGADSITPAGTVTAPTFTGVALGTHTHQTLAVGTSPAHSHTNLAAGGAHAHELPMQQVSGSQVRMIASSAFGNATSRAAVSQFTTTANTTSAAVMLSQSVTPTYAASATSANAVTFAGTASASAANGAGTPSGTNSVPSFTGTAFDNRSAFTRVIFCAKT